MKREPNPSNTAASWRIELLGRLRASCGDLELTRFGSRKISALLARLAMFPRRSHSREELIDLLWPDADLDTGRNRLRQALATLRRSLEPPGLTDVLLADRNTVRLNPVAFHCDVAEFEACVGRRDAAGALALYAGELLPGHYDEWILEERNRLACLAEDLGDPVAVPAGAGLRMQATQTTRPDRKELLPAFVARFFGREVQCALLERMLLTERLITLQGAGGTGKTRLAAEVAQRVRERFEVVAFVALAECSRADELAARLRAAVQLPDVAGDPLEQLTLLLEGRPALLVLDNFEQLVGHGGPDFLERLLQRLPELRVLVSSRRALDLDGERLFEVAPLPLPAAEDDLVASAANPSVALFVDRAQGVRPGFALSAANHVELVALCRELEGVPLAIELAASRAHALSVADMRAQMSQRFALLARKGARATRAPRHASLDAAIDWSWQLLNDDERTCLAALSVFREGWVAAAAGAVWARNDAHDMLGKLVADSLVRAEVGADGALRYHLFEMVREFVAGRLDRVQRDALREQHRAWCLGLLRASHSALPAAEVPNLLQAMRSALEDQLPRSALLLALAAESHWERRGVAPEVRQLWRDALQQASAPNPAAAPEVQAARCLFARCLYQAGEAEVAKALADEAVATAGDDPTLRAQALAVQLKLRWMDGVHRGPALVDEVCSALALTAASGDASTRAALLNLLGEIRVLGSADAAGATPCYAEALTLFETLGETRRAWEVRLGQGLCEQVVGRYDAAFEIHARVAAAALELDDPVLLTDAYNNMAVVCAKAHRWEAAVQHCRAQLGLATRQYSRYMQVYAVWNLAKPLARCHRAEAAAQLMAFSAHAWEQDFAPLTAADRRYMRRVRRLAEVQLGLVQVAALWAGGERLVLADAVALALGH